MTSLIPLKNYKKIILIIFPFLFNLFSAQAEDKVTLDVNQSAFTVIGRDFAPAVIHQQARINNFDLFTFNPPDIPQKQIASKAVPWPFGKPAEGLVEGIVNGVLRNVGIPGNYDADYDTCILNIYSSLSNIHGSVGILQDSIVLTHVGSQKVKIEVKIAADISARMRLEFRGCHTGGRHASFDLRIKDIIASGTFPLEIKNETLSLKDIKNFKFKFDGIWVRFREGSPLISFIENLNGALNFYGGLDSIVKEQMQKAILKDDNQGKIATELRNSINTILVASASINQSANIDDVNLTLNAKATKLVSPDKNKLRSEWTTTISGGLAAPVECAANLQFEERPLQPAQFRSAGDASLTVPVNFAEKVIYEAAKKGAFCAVDQHLPMFCREAAPGRPTQICFYDALSHHTVCQDGLAPGGPIHEVEVESPPLAVGVEGRITITPQQNAPVNALVSVPFYFEIMHPQRGKVYVHALTNVMAVFSINNKNGLQLTLDPRQTQIVSLMGYEDVRDLFCERDEDEFLDWANNTISAIVAAMAPRQITTSVMFMGEQYRIGIDNRNVQANPTQIYLPLQLSCSNNHCSRVGEDLSCPAGYQVDDQTRECKRFAPAVCREGGNYLPDSWGLNDHMQGEALRDSCSINLGFNNRVSQTYCPAIGAVYHTQRGRDQCEEWLMGTFSYFFIDEADNVLVPFEG